MVGGSKKIATKEQRRLMRKGLLIGFIGLISLGLGIRPAYAAAAGVPDLIAQVQKRDPGRSAEAKPSQSDRREADRAAAQAPNSPDKARLFSVRFLSSKTYSRVTMDLSHEVRYEIHRLKEDPSKGLPP